MTKGAGGEGVTLEGGLPSSMQFFNINKVLPPREKYRPVITLVGGRGSGKSVCLEHMMFETKHRYDFAMAMTITKSTVDMLEKHIPPVFVYQDGYDYDKFDDFMNLTSQICLEGQTHHCLVVLDDLAYDPAIFKTKSQRQVHMNGRHQYVTVYDTFQFSMDIPYFLRGCIDILMCFLDMNPANIKRLYEYFFKRPEFPTLKIFSKVFISVTSDYGILVWLKSPTGKFDDCIQFFKAKLKVEDFRIGWDEYWTFSEELQKRNQLKLAEKKNKQAEEKLRIAEERKRGKKRKAEGAGDGNDDQPERKKLNF